MEYSRFWSKWTSWICTSCISATITLIWLRYIKANSNDTKVLFYDPTRNGTSCQCRKYFDIHCLDANCSSVQTREIIYCLRRATQTIDICMFTISNKPISNEIIIAHNRGILIRIIVSNCILLLQSKELKCFRDIGIEVKYQKITKKNHMHNKYAIVDSKYLINGSMNWTHQATFDNWENVIVTNSPNLVATFSNIFEQTWATVDL